MTEDQIERAVERKFNALDRRLMAGDLTQADYDELAKCIAAWAESEYRRIPSPDEMALGGYRYLLAHRGWVR